jgi:hypothetical protein
MFTRRRAMRGYIVFCIEAAIILAVIAVVPKPEESTQPGPTIVLPGPATEDKVEKPAPPTTTWENSIRSKPVQEKSSYQPDVVLARYTGFYYPDHKQSELASKAYRHLGCPRVIAYPGSYTPILIPNEEIPRVKRMLGDERFVILSPYMK